MLNSISEALQFIELQKEKRKEKLSKLSIYVCVGTGCTAKGALKVYEEFQRVLLREGLLNSVKLAKIEDSENPLKKTGCCGRCSNGPLVNILPHGYFYSHVTVNDVEKIVEKTIKRGEPLEELLLIDPVTNDRVRSLEDSTLYKNQNFYIMEDIGKCECDSIEDYMARGGYSSLIKVLSQMQADEIIEMIKNAGLRGRGGGGFPTGLKWEAAKNSKSDVKFVVCNGDEGDPGAFMNRTLLERDPHLVLEGMIIAGYTIGAQKAYAYIRAEYPIAIQMFQKAIDDAKKLGLLGENILQTGFSFDVEIKEGAGAFVCGEETALLASIEGKRGMPRPRPPFPAQSGLWGYPTLINNVETYANISRIIRDGVEKYRLLGTENSPGTKMFSVTGPLKVTGIIEVEFGTTLRKIIYEICGGLLSGEEFKAVQIGGPSGACLSKEFLDMPLDYDTLKSADAMVGSGGIVVITKRTCMVEVARFFLDFTKRESCGKCIPCREGTMQAYNILEKFTQAKATEEDLENLEFLANLIKKTSLCGLGKTAPNPILSTLKLFKDEYLAHLNGVCPSGTCVSFKKYVVNEQLCKGCGLCAKSCPQNAIFGERGKPYKIDQEKCIKCGLCVQKCRFKAIEMI
ncbi:NADH-ubiquinone oxidoreductase-F iron-sulfur binding region domain-containing protein [Pseudothermotoga elfii]|uniref:NADH-ubiquinone oxidoreductase-F iron-sulfur binding region domain-containing protein n=1 Tax=Pseudothermotoga elfii TaxID=38322 RepID=UPI0003F5A3EA|nr:NADH-ubiquinone oxidoreductase-F iron-sulfur binding region domain-containing protein [Pseudothermotoga elfii]